MQQEQMKVLVLGIGNLLWADEGFGVRCAERLANHYRFDASVTVMDGGTQGLYLLPYVQAADVLLIFDAVDFGLAPGSMHIIENDEVPAYMGARKMSLHQTGFQEVLASARLLGQAPGQVLLIGVQPLQIEDYGGSLSEPVRARLPEAEQIAIEYLQAFGVAIQPLDAAPDGAWDATPVALQDYEAGRPDARRACRHGDERFLGLRANLDRSNGSHREVQP